MSLGAAVSPDAAGEDAAIWEALLSPINKLEQQYQRSPLGAHERSVGASLDAALQGLLEAPPEQLPCAEMAALERCHASCTLRPEYAVCSRVCMCPLARGIVAL